MEDEGKEEVIRLNCPYCDKIIISLYERQAQQNLHDHIFFKHKKEIEKEDLGVQDLFK